jgi:hypothetical protein
MTLEILGFSDPPDNNIEDDKTDSDYTKWADIDVALGRLRERAAAGNKAASVELTEAGPAMQAEMDRLARQRRQKIEQTAPSYDDIHSSAD